MEFFRKDFCSMKLSELADIKERMKNKVALRTGEKANRIVVSMGSCGISSGAREVLNAFADAVGNDKLFDRVSVEQSSCIGLCDLEPVAQVFTENGEKVTYVKMTADRAREVVEKHIKGGQPIKEYTVDKNGGKA